MTVCEYIVKYLKEHGITHFFGYQGTMIAYFVDAIYREEGVFNHVAYNEQGAALAASGYAKTNGEMAVAYATSGPGAVNLLQGIADAFYDSVPVLFITGQLNISEYTHDPQLRQQGFQQTDIVSICKPITKCAKMLTNPNDTYDVLDTLMNSMLSKRKGPVLLDIPMDIQHAQLDNEKYNIQSFLSNHSANIYRSLSKEVAHTIFNCFKTSKRPVLLLGNGISKNDICRKKVQIIIEKLRLPVVTTLLAKDLLSSESEFNYGILGYSYGHRYANLIVNTKADFIISLGARLCPRQTGMDTENFAKNAKIIRIDIDRKELNHNIHKDDITYCISADEVIDELLIMDNTVRYDKWLEICNNIKYMLSEVDNGKDYRNPNNVVRNISQLIADDTVIACDVGQHQMWVAQSFINKKNQRILFSGAHGAMGFALPAAIGAYYCSGKSSVCIAGDGAFQMNIQELQWVVHEQIPIKIIIFNNHSLGLIRQQQCAIFDNRFCGSVYDSGYSTPSFSAVASAYGIKAAKIEYFDILNGNAMNELSNLLKLSCPVLIEIDMESNTYVYPKTSYGMEMHNQFPHIPVEVIEKISQL